MLSDARLLVSGSISGTNNAITGQTIAATNATVLSSYSVDLDSVPGGGVAIDAGQGQPLYFRYVVQTAPSAGTSVQFNVLSSTTADLSTGTVNTLATSGATPVATLVAGYEGYIVVPPLPGNIEAAEYLGASYTCVGAVAGLVIVGEFTLSIEDPKKFYKSGFTVI